MTLFTGDKVDHSELRKLLGLLELYLETISLKAESIFALDGQGGETLFRVLLLTIRFAYARLHQRPPFPLALFAAPQSRCFSWTKRRNYTKSFRWRTTNWYVGRSAQNHRKDEAGHFLKHGRVARKQQQHSAVCAIFQDNAQLCGELGEAWKPNEIVLQVNGENVPGATTYPSREPVRLRQVKSPINKVLVSCPAARSSTVFQMATSSGPRHPKQTGRPRPKETASKKSSSEHQSYSKSTAQTERPACWTSK